MKNIMKVLAALAAIAGVAYVIATYGDKIVAWVRSILPTCPCQCEGTCENCSCTKEEETPAEEPVEEEVPVEEVVVADPTTADDADFAD